LFHASPRLIVRPRLSLSPSLSLNPNLVVKPRLSLSPSLSLNPNLVVRPRLSLSPGLSLRPRLRLRLSPGLSLSPNLKPSPRLNLGLSLRGIRHCRTWLMGLSWVNGFTIHGGFANRSGVLQSNAGAIAAFEVHASSSGQETSPPKNILHHFKRGAVTVPGDFLANRLHFQLVDQLADTMEIVGGARSAHIEVDRRSIDCSVDGTHLTELDRAMPVSPTAADVGVR
jgi:hypothetical protein